MLSRSLQFARVVGRQRCHSARNGIRTSLLPGRTVAIRPSPLFSNLPSCSRSFSSNSETSMTTSATASPDAGAGADAGADAGTVGENAAKPADALSPPQSSSSSISSNRNSSNNNNSNNKSNDERHVTMYERNAERNMIPRIATGISYFITAYWTWYVTDFVPAVNASPIEDLHIDPTIGYLGMGLGLMTNIVATLYPIQTISKISMPVTSSQPYFRVHMHTFPFIQPSAKFVDYPLGKLYLDTKSGDTKTILNQFKGDISQFRGHLGISIADHYVPILMEIRDANELTSSKQRNQRFVEALLLHVGEATAQGRKPKKGRRVVTSQASAKPSKLQFKKKRGSRRHQS